MKKNNIIVGDLNSSSDGGEMPDEHSVDGKTVHINNERPPLSGRTPQK